MTYILGALVGIFPFFSIPWTSGVLYPFQSELLILSFTIFFLAYVLLKRKNESIKLSDIFPVLLLFIVTLFSYFFSVDRVQSFFGGGISLYSVQTVFILLSVWVLGRAHGDKNDIFRACIGFLGVSIFAHIYIFFGYIFGFSWFINPFGTVVSASVYVGLSALIGVYVLLEKKHVPIAAFSLLLSIASLTVTDWYLLPSISFSLVTFIFSFIGVYTTKGPAFIKKRVVLVSFIGLFILQLCAPWVADLFISHSQRFEVDKHNVQVELGASVYVAEKVFGSSFSRMLFGTGPATYTFAWHQFKPTELPGSVNITKYWDYDFPEAGSLILTQVTTLGLLGFLLWMYLSLLVVHAVRKSIVSGELQSVYISLTTLLILVVLWLSSVNIGLYVLFFILLAIVFEPIHSVPHMKVKKEYVYIVLIASLMCISWNTIKAYRSVLIIDSVLVDLYAYTHQGIQELQSAEQKISTALPYFDNTEYRRLLSNLVVAQVDQGQFGSSTSIELLTKAEQYLSPVIKNSVHFRDWMQMGRVYEYQTMFGATSSAPLAYQAYTIASVLAPTHPEPFYALSLIHLYAGNYIQANESVKKTLLLKPNYTEALMLYKQLNATNTNILGNMGV